MASAVPLCKWVSGKTTLSSPLSLLSANRCRPNSIVYRGSRRTSFRGGMSTAKVVVCSIQSGEAETSDEEWLKRLPNKNKPLYSHSLPCIEAWLKQLGFHQTKEDRAVWLIEKPEWHAQLSLDLTDLYIRYLKSGPGDLDKDVDRRFSYALSREDIENAILGGP
uniref:Uncharacterized protein n=1 Tax=Kalanchoe fedtschenkoi TaxID=63787 RepID=A0A7N0T3T4_KALFE